MENFGIAAVAAITAICYLVGYCVKCSSMDSKYIPAACGIVGGILGPVGLAIMPEFPAADMLTAVAVGIVSGLAATGVDQAIRQIKGGGANG